MSVSIPPPHELVVDPKTGMMNEVWYRWFTENVGTFDGQLAFPATQNASTDVNTLDDYEEGTWTPTLTFGGGSTGITYGTRIGTYTKIGNLVCAVFKIILTSKGSSTGSAVLTGLPFTPATSVNAQGYFDKLIPGAGAVPQMVSSGTTLLFRALNETTGGDSSLTDTAFAATSVVDGSVIFSV